MNKAISNFYLNPQILLSFRVEIVLSGFGFTGGNSIACTNLCRDEVTSVLKDKIEAAFGSSFNTNGLGGVLTCGVTGMGAGLSHSPKCDVSLEVATNNFHEIFVTRLCKITLTCCFCSPPAVSAMSSSLSHTSLSMLLEMWVLSPVLGGLVAAVPAERWPSAWASSKPRAMSATARSLGFMTLWTPSTAS